MSAATGLPMPPARPVRVLIVEDSTVVRHLLAHIIGRDPRLEVAGAVASAEEALASLHRVRPDVISMDIRLPGMDGLEATSRIMAERPTPIVVIADSVDDASLSISMNALKAGALTVVEKPVGTTSAGYEAVASTIATQLYIMSQVPVIRQRQRFGAPPPTTPPGAEDAPAQPLAVVALAASTGGPPALARVLGGLSADFPIPILLVQHMGESFMEGFAAWLNGLVALDVRIARDREPARPGVVHVAPGDRHLLYAPGGFLRLSSDPPLGGQRPSATLLFQSLAKSAGARAAAALLTGMGEDGALGLGDLRRAGGCTMAEDESTAVVYGMPAAAARLGAAQAMLPIDEIAPRLLRLARERRP